MKKSILFATIATLLITSSIALRNGGAQEAEEAECAPNQYRDA